MIAKRKISKAEAAFKERHGGFPNGMTWEQARDWVDQKTFGELDCTQLDLLTDWIIEARAKSPRRLRETPEEGLY